MRSGNVTQSNLSVQLYTVRGAIAEDLPLTLERIAAIGFTQVEPYNFVARLEEYRTAFAANGLTAPSAHAKLSGEDIDVIFAAARELGVQTVIDPHIDEARWASPESIAEIAAELNAMAATAAGYGLRVGYHNHAFELEIQHDGVSALEILASHLDDTVLLELDSYWAAVGGQDVPALLGRLGSRVQFLHVKDGPITKDNKEQLAAGAGVMPIEAILAANPTALRVVELDDFDGDVFEAIADSYAYLTELAAADGDKA
jgi:sugar phosphate isomerase/epimerase